MYVAEEYSHTVDVLLIPAITKVLLSQQKQIP